MTNKASLIISGCTIVIGDYMILFTDRIINIYLFIMTLFIHVWFIYILQHIPTTKVQNE